MQTIVSAIIDKEKSNNYLILLLTHTLPIELSDSNVSE